MTVEKRLRSLILDRYKSVREFSIMYDIPYTTMKSMLSRGVGNSSVSNVIKVCKALGISADALADGEIVPVQHRDIKLVNDRIEVKEVIDDVKTYLSSRRDLTLDGQRVSHETVDFFIDGLDVIVEMTKKKTVDQ